VYTEKAVEAISKNGFSGLFGAGNEDTFPRADLRTGAKPVADSC
jgi:hypothetical protein